MEIFTKSAEETKNFGREFANSLKGGEILALVGGLGSGKTTFVQGLAEGLGLEDRVISPTFLLMREHKIKNSKLQISEACCRTVTNFYHIDLYRLETDIENELLNIGVTDLLGKPENLVVIEWADKVREALPRDAIWITFEQVDEFTHKIIV